MHLDSVCELLDEHSCVNVAQPKLVQKFPQIREIDELLLVVLLPEKTDFIDYGSEVSFLLEELGADDWKNVAIRDMEGSANSPKMMNPRVEVDD